MARFYLPQFNYLRQPPQELIQLKKQGLSIPGPLILFSKQGLDAIAGNTQNKIPMNT